jgi:hypothetical protein
VKSGDESLEIGPLSQEVNQSALRIGRTGVEPVGLQAEQ